MSYEPLQTRAFASVSEMALFDATGLPDSFRVSCSTIKDDYRLIITPTAALTAAIDGVNVIAAAAPSGAVWCRLFTQNVTAQYETAWFLDASSGSDINNGITVGTPLKTIRELTNRLRGAKISANVTITLAAGDYSADPVNFDLEITQGVSILMVGNVSSSSDTIASVTATTPGTASTNAGAARGSVTGTTYNFTSTNDRQRLRITSGTALDAMSFVTKVTTTGIGGVIKVTRWGKLGSASSTPATPRTSTIVTNFAPASLSTFAIDTLNSQIGFLNMRTKGSGRFVIQDCLVRPSGTVTVTHRCFSDNGNGNGVMLYGCILQAASSLLFQGGSFTLAVCSISADNGNIVYSGVNNAQHRLCVWTGTAATPVFTLNVQDNTIMGIHTSACIDGGNMLITLGGLWDNQGEANNDVQFVDGNSTVGVIITGSGTWWSHTTGEKVWGLDNSYSVAAIWVTQGIWYYDSIPSIPGGVVDIKLGGTGTFTTASWANLPLELSYTSGAVGAGITAVPGAGSLISKIN